MSYDNNQLWSYSKMVSSVTVQRKVNYTQTERKKKYVNVKTLMRVCTDTTQRETERQRQRDRERDRQTDRQTQRQTDDSTDTRERYRDRQTDRETQRQTDRR